MKNYLPIVYIVLRFLGIYLIFFVLYQLYIGYYHNTILSSDPFSDWVACQSSFILRIFGIPTQVIQVEKAPYVWLFFKNTYVAKVTEGCNALAVMIFFAAFVFGFYQGFKKTFLFVGIGLVTIHVANVIRIAFVSWVYNAFPDYSVMVHDYVFPAIIYGVVMVLWLYWVKFQVLKK